MFVYQFKKASIYHGLSLDVLRGMPENSMDAVVTDPPYGFAFMGKKWDYELPSVETWAEVLRVLKPGGHLLAFGGPRTYHRAVCRIEDAGFEIRDCLMWIFGSGFPKSLNLEGEWEGYGTALKPAYEPIVLARKPLDGTVAANVQTWGVGALNIDGCRIDLNGDYKCGANGRPSQTGLGDNYDPAKANQHSNVGRWPANVIHDGSEEVVGMFPETVSGGGDRGSVNNSIFCKTTGDYARIFSASSGSAARFFYCAKATAEERNEGLDHLPERVKVYNGQAAESSEDMKPVEKRFTTMARNTHPTVKPLALMRYLCRLICPPDGVILDPFFGSGSTGVAAIQEGFRVIGIEREADHCEIAKGRVSHAISIIDKNPALPFTTTEQAAQPSGQASLFGELTSTASEYTKGEV